MNSSQLDSESFLSAQQEISFTHEILAEIIAYKKVLQHYIVTELQTQHPEIYVGYFNCHPLLNQLNLRSNDPLMNIYNDLAKNAGLRLIFCGRYNITRALVNYQKMDNAFNILTFSPANVAISPALATPAGRLHALFYRYPSFQSHLKTISNLRVDFATHVIKDFFARIVAEIRWIFSAPYRQQKIFTRKIKQYCHQYNLFKNKSTEMDRAAEQSMHIKPSLH